MHIELNLEFTFKWLYKWIPNAFLMIIYSTMYHIFQQQYAFDRKSLLYISGNTVIIIEKYCM